MDSTLKTVKSEEQKLMDTINNGKVGEPTELEKFGITEKQAEYIKSTIEATLLKPTKHEVVNEPTVKVQFPEVQKVAGEVSITEAIIQKLASLLKLPEVLNVKGKVEADVKFPEVQKITGEVTAKVQFPDIAKFFKDAIASIKFPETQKVTGSVDATVKFPEIQKVDTGLPFIKETYGGKAPRPDQYVPVRIVNGKQFVDMTTSIQGGFSGMRSVLENLSSLIGKSVDVTSTGGSASSSGDNTLLGAVVGKGHKVNAFSLTTLSTTAVTCIFKDTDDVELWRVVLQAPSGVNSGANLALPAPAYIFKSLSSKGIKLNLSSAQAVHWSLSYRSE